MNAINVTHDRLIELNGNKLVSMFVFVAKTGVPLNPKLLKLYFEALKKSIKENNFTSKHDMATCLSIFMKVVSKLLTLQYTKAAEHPHYEMVRDYFTFFLTVLKQDAFFFKIN